jgi:hypothetical protein
VLLSVSYIDAEIFAWAICRANEVSQLNSGMNPRDGGLPSMAEMGQKCQSRISRHASGLTLTADRRSVPSFFALGPKPEIIWMSSTFPLAPQLPDICVLIRPQRDYLLFHHQTRKEWLGDLGD